VDSPTDDKPAVFPILRTGLSTIESNRRLFIYVIGFDYIIVNNREPSKF
jgi:hypothetical protein